MNHPHNKLNASQEWLTPPKIIEALGPFDLDPCATVDRPWNTAKKHYDCIQNGLWNKWDGRVWLNPPYGSETVLWIQALASHGNGIALIFARTETKMFFDFIWPKADAIMFLKGRITFYHKDGSLSKNNSGSASVLIAYGSDNADILEKSGIDGFFIRLKQ